MLAETRTLLKQITQADQDAVNFVQAVRQADPDVKIALNATSLGEVNKALGNDVDGIIENGAALPINKMQRLPKMVILSTGPTELYQNSTLLCPALRGKFTQAALDKTQWATAITRAAAHG